MGTLRFVCLSLIFCSFAIAGETDLATIVQKPGHLVFLKSEFIPSHLRDGTPINGSLVIYGKMTQDKVSCTGDYTTATGPWTHRTPTDLNILAGTSYSWATNITELLPPYSYEALSGNRYIETFRLMFPGSNSLLQLNCDVSHKSPEARATVADFEEATDGVMTLTND